MKGDKNEFITHFAIPSSFSFILVIEDGYLGSVPQV